MKKSLIPVIISIIVVICMSFMALSCADEVRKDPYDVENVNSDQYEDGQTETTVSVDTLEINQSLSYDYNEATGECSLMDNFVSGKNTIVFARTSTPFSDYEENISLKMTLYNGTETEYNQFAALSNEYCAAFLIPAEDVAVAGDYTFSVWADGCEICSRSEYLAGTKELSVLFVPIKARFDASVAIPENYVDLLRHTAAVYPIATNNILSEIGSVADLSGEAYDICTSEGLYRVWNYLAGRVSEKYDVVIGLVSGKMGESQSLDTYSFGYPAVIINVENDCYQAAISHELAHFYLVGDEYNGGVFNPDANEAPVGYTGVSIYDRDETVVSENVNVKNAADFGLTASGSAVEERLIPCNTNDGTVYTNKVSFMGELEGSSWDYWITPAVWDRLYEAFILRDFEVAAGSDSGIFIDDLGKTSLFCGDCFEYSVVTNDNLYGYCEHCYCLTEMAPDGNFIINCRNCGAMNENPPTFIACQNKNCGSCHRLHVYSSDAYSCLTVDRKYSVGSFELSQNPTIEVLKVSGALLLTEDGYKFEAGKIRRSVGHVDDVTTDATEGVCAFGITDIDGFIITSVYLDPELTVLTDPPSRTDTVPVSFTVRLPDNGFDLVFFNSVFDENGYSGLKYGGYTKSISSISIEK